MKKRSAESAAARVRRLAIPCQMGPDFGPTDAHGRTYRPVAIMEIAESPTSTVKVARRGDLLDLMHIPQGHRLAGRIYRQAVEHMEAGKGMGPLPFARDVAGDSGVLVWLAPQERALSAADWHRRGVEAMGQASAQGVVNWVIVRGLPLVDYDATRQWRKGTASAQLRAALERLAAEYGT